MTVMWQWKGIFVCGCTRKKWRDKKLPDKCKISTRYQKEVGYPARTHQKALLESENIHFLA